MWQFFLSKNQRNPFGGSKVMIVLVGRSSNPNWEKFPAIIGRVSQPKLGGVPNIRHHPHRKYDFFKKS